MAYVAPVTRSTGFVVGSTQWNELVNNDLWYGSARPICKARRNTDVSIPNNTNTAVPWDANNFDTTGCHSIAVNPSRFTATVHGLYRFSTNLFWASNGAGARAAHLIINGTGTLQASVTDPAAAALGINQFVQVELALALNDYVEVVSYQNSGGGLAIAGTGTGSSAGSWAYFEWIGNF